MTLCVSSMQAIGILFEFPVAFKYILAALKAVGYLGAIWIALFWKILGAILFRWLFSTDKRFEFRFIPVFFFVEFFLTFFQAVIGFASFIFRLIVTFFSTLILLFRVDLRCMIDAFNKLDYGFHTYCAVLSLEKREMNHILWAFICHCNQRHGASYPWLNGIALPKMNRCSSKNRDTEDRFLSCVYNQIIYRCVCVCVCVYFFILCV